ncbi:ORF6N domain-containing protein [Salmonella enterica subsp. enterica serovar Kisangani]|nr:ORF6N domain-containing protein [Salmonella enterica subsp. enterica serovar Kisangani]ECN7767706.1 ORF6N domain-containing protein [Salmonella enterica subsp. enterica serovar Enteritidis]ECA2177730.1 ORF6N domain-containing protein [Salmonella enterica subsp. enterica serovar Kisangani]EDF0160005.1 ORF6N domain-containing protein [Salmonella enterica subsp. enterica serovar Kisangani]EDS9959556.1 ORF6N domain-containing protein [Salmonella enterica subsp. enterica serovar Kisangani]
MPTQISVEALSLITHNQIPVITTELLAQLYNTDPVRIRQNYSRNEDRFVVGKHYFLLEGDELRELKHRVSQSYSVKIARNVRSLILWTERGAARHAKMLETDQAWDVFEKLEDCYFSKSKSPSRNEEPYAVITYFENGLPVAHHPLMPGEIVMTFESFLDMARQRGWLVMRKEQILERLMQF